SCWFIAVLVTCYFFFFSSRRRHTRLVSDWSSDVCSSDLLIVVLKFRMHGAELQHLDQAVVEAIAPLPEQHRSRAVEFDQQGDGQIGRASCRERGKVWGGAGDVKKKRGRERG